MRALVLGMLVSLNLSLASAVAANTGEGALRAAFAAMAQQDWDRAEALVSGQGQVTRDLVTWTRLRAGEGELEDYLRFLTARPDWPGQDRLRAAGEEIIAEGHDPAEVLAFFDGQSPQTGEGAVRLAEAFYAQGQDTDAEEMLAEAWLGLGLTDEGHAAMIEAYRDVLAPHHHARTQAMLWRSRATDAARMLPLLSGTERAVADARIALIRRTGNADARVQALPDEAQDDVGLAYERFNQLADSGNYTNAIELLLERTTSAETLGEPFRWASWRAALVRWDMRQGRHQRAYDMAVAHQLTEGAFYADLEWLAGYISLQFLDEPAQALTHFQNIDAAVEGPISASRAGYWIGRSQEVLGDADAARAAYEAAAVHQTAFYGLLAAEKLALPLDPALTGRDGRVEWQGSPVLQSDLTQAGLLLLAGGERGSAVLFFAKLGQTLDAEGIAQLGTLLADMNEPFLTVLVGKAAAARGIVLPAIYYPMHEMAAMELPVAPELALSIARRESEFNPVVGSPVGALGLMQLMPGTAEEVAGELGLPYSRARLTSDWEYNAQLGAHYLANLEASFGNTPVLVAAGYNAGPSRPRTWMSERGDPRGGDVDVIDWIEMIPFTETRNYVMRVTESMPAYRARLTGETGPVQFTALLRGERPLIRPVARGQTRAAASPVPQAATVATPSPMQTQSALAPSRSLRPVNRPAGG